MNSVTQHPLKRESLGSDLETEKKFWIDLDQEKRRNCSLAGSGDWIYHGKKPL
jgi:hypothetical protein